LLLVETGVPDQDHAVGSNESELLDDFPRAELEVELEVELELEVAVGVRDVEED
jgi:hypothetical protein